MAKSGNQKKPAEKRTETEADDRNDRLKGAASAIRKQQQEKDTEVRTKAESSEAANKTTERLDRILKMVSGQQTQTRIPGIGKGKKSGKKKQPKPIKRREWPKGELTTQQKIYWYGGLFLRALAPLLLYALMPSLCLTLGYVFGGHQDDGMSMEEFFTYGANFYTTVGTFLTLWLLHNSAKRRGSTVWEESTLFLKEMKPVKAIGFFAFGFASATAVSALLTLLPKFFLTLGYAEASSKMYLGRDTFFTLITILILAPVVEEIIFRGHMLNTLLEHIPEKTAILISSIIFSVMHGNLIWILYAFLLGQILAKTSMKEDNIAYGVLLHSGFNATAVVNFFISNNEHSFETFFGSKALIAFYGVAGVAVSLFLAAVYTGRLDLKMAWRRIRGK